MTFFNAFNFIKKTHSNNDMIIYECIYHLSKKVKNIDSFITNRNEQIDFSFDRLLSMCNEYFKNNKPLGHILKEANFLGMKLKVFPGVLTPRNETELVCEIIKDKVIEIFDKESINIVDLCCGTGCIGLYFKKIFPNSNVFAVDISPIAIENTQENSTLLNLSIKTFNDDFIEAILNNDIKVDVIISNPPYVSSDELDLNLTKYESKESFINSEDPLFFYKKIIGNIEKLIKNKNKFLIGFEISSTQEKELEEIVKSLPYKYQFFKDWSDKYRVLIIWKN